MTDHQPTQPQWEMLPGALDTAMLAFARRPGVLRCNTYLLRTPEYVLVIDPGADQAQALAAADTARALTRELPRQAALCLTHCHLDHCAATGAFLDALPEATVVCHSAGAEALRRGDADLTLAALTALAIPALGDIHALFAGPGPAGVSRAMDTPDGGLRSLSIPIGPRDALQVYHTPGHSPDSVCYRVGGALFAGDLPFATGPGLVALPGWNGVQLAASLGKILWLLDHCNVTTVLPGHGRALARGEARRVMADMLGGLRGHAQLTTPRQDTAFPEALLGACATLLDEAGAPQAPGLPQTLPPPSALPGLHQRAARRGRAREQTLAAPERAGLPAARATRRARHRLGDFLCALHGFRFADHAGPVEVNHAVATLLADLSSGGRLTGFALGFVHSTASPRALMDPEVLADLVETALEAYKGCGASGATVAVHTRGNAVAVAVEPAPGTTALPGPCADYLRLAMQAYGGAFEAAPDRCTLLMPRVEEDR